MSSYGPQGGPYPGQPQDPWQDGSGGDPYHTGYPDPLTEAHAGGPAYARPDHTPNSVSGEVWNPPQTPARQGRSATAIGVIIVVVLLAIGGAAAAAVFLTRGDNGAGPGADKSKTPAASTPASASPTSTVNADARAAKEGDCLLNKGSADKPDMQKVTCAANTYQVLKRINGTSDHKKCEGTPNLTDWYFFDHAEDAQDFVLCLRKR